MRPPGLLLSTLLLLIAARAAEDETLNVLSSLRQSLKLYAGDGSDAEAARALRSSVTASTSSPATAHPAPVLAYITPWNGAGYDLAKRHRCRLHFLAPVWFQLRAAKGAPQLTGSHDVDPGWMEAVRAPCPGSSLSSDSSGPSAGQAHAARVLPRIIFEVGGPDLSAILARPQAVASLLVGAAQEHRFDGWVLEAWSGWAAMGVTRHHQAREAALQLLRQLAAQLHSAGRALVLAVSPLLPAPGRPALLTAGDAAELLSFADALSVMTYDHATQQPGPNAPLPWVAQNADAFAAVADRLPGGAARRKVLLGIPFYGHEYRFQGKQLVQAEAVTSNRLLEVLKQKAQPAAHAAAAGSAEGAGSVAAAAEQQQQRQEGTCSAEEAERDAGAGVGAWTATGESSGGRRKHKQRGGRDELSTTWLGKAGEHLFEWREAVAAPDGATDSSGSSKRKKAKHRLFFPTPRAVAERLAVSAERGLGVSVWELGQGLEGMVALL